MHGMVGAVADQHGVETEPDEIAPQQLEAGLVGAAALLDLARVEPHLPRALAAWRRRAASTTPSICGKLCSQTGSCTITGHDVPAAADRLRPRLRRHRRDEVREHEDEAADRDGAADGRRESSSAQRDVVRRCVERRAPDSRRAGRGGRLRQTLDCARGGSQYGRPCAGLAGMRSRSRGRRRASVGSARSRRARGRRVHRGGLVQPRQVRAGRAPSPAAGRRRSRPRDISSA